MDILAQRELGMKLAQNYGADALQGVIGDRTADYSAIFAAAGRYLRSGEVIDAVLAGPPEWAFYALTNIPNIDPADRARLVAKAQEDPFTAANTLRGVRGIDAHAEALTQAAGSYASSQGTISGFYLNNKGSYNCEFTMYWVDNGQVQPKKGSTPDKWVWSSKLMVGQDEKKACVDFALSGSPLKEGDTVWMYLWVQAGQDIESPLRFVYSSAVADYAWFTSSGCTQSDSLALDKVASPPS
ncbi:hypothetical protein FSB78_01575 [Sphingomonas ginsenosidivorax]|uniref:Uncharacterized protein n=1 Tax=Sphingomonas ginsenosidivorax TaxID=862135 RepID=A0A5C6UBA0_9SPHN|nr:hypothetical protein [Sphingomonas ginsenosidivorax]TXC69790.1 hypothetical protein FSB78_01575 [Sphingomonas ginsenosidivorax]